MSIALTFDGSLSRVRVTGAVPGLLDTFTRTVADGWGTSDSGAVWSVGGAASDYSTDGAVGALSLGSVNIYRQASTPALGSDVDFQATFRVDAFAAGADLIAELAARRPDANNEYYARIAFAPGGSISLLVRKRVGGVVTTFTTVPTGMIHNNLASQYNLRLAVVGSQIKAKTWLSTTVEPDWQVSVIDSELSTAGDQAVRAVLASGNSNTLPVLVTVDDVVSRGTATVERSTDQIRWTSVRGGAGLDGGSGAAVQVDDYEFEPNVVNYYRVRRLSDQDVASITPTMESVWVKNLARPFLNRPVTVVDWSDEVHESRNAVLPIIGRRDPIGLSDVRMAKKYTITVMLPTVAAARELVATFASGEPVLIHVPGEDCPVPGGYAVIGDLSVARGGNPRSVRRFIELPLIQTAAPGPDVVGATMTWQTVISTYATWADVIAANATWQDLLDGIADPGDVVVG